MSFDFFSGITNFLRFLLEDIIKKPVFWFLGKFRTFRIVIVYAYGTTDADLEDEEKIALGISLLNKNSERDLLPVNLIIKSRNSKTTLYKGGDTPFKYNQLKSTYYTDLRYADFKRFLGEKVKITVTDTFGRKASIHCVFQNEQMYPEINKL